MTNNFAQRCFGGFLFYLILAVLSFVLVVNKPAGLADIETYRTLYQFAPTFNNFSFFEFKYNWGFYFLNVSFRSLGLDFEIFHILYVLGAVFVAYLLTGCLLNLVSWSSLFLCLLALLLIAKAPYVDESIRQWPVVLLSGFVFFLLEKNRYLYASVMLFLLSLFHYSSMFILLFWMIWSLSGEGRVVPVIVGGVLLALFGFFLIYLYPDGVMVELLARLKSYEELNVKYYPGIQHHFLSVLWYSVLLIAVSMLFFSRERRYLGCVFVVIAACIIVSFYYYTLALRILSFLLLMLLLSYFYFSNSAFDRCIYIGKKFRVHRSTWGFLVLCVGGVKLLF